MQPPERKRTATTGIVLGAMTIAVLCASFMAVRPQGTTVAKSGHFHTRIIYVGHAPKLANG